MKSQNGQSDNLLPILDVRKEVSDSPRVYVTRWASNGKPYPINQANGVDKQGRIYIGCSKNLQKGIRAFQRGIKSGKISSHKGAQTYNCFRFKRKFPVNQLEVKWSIRPRDWKEEESRLLKAYVLEFLDRPPINHKSR